jgi:hypothetical protein
MYSQKEEATLDLRTAATPGVTSIPLGQTVSLFELMHMALVQQIRVSECTHTHTHTHTHTRARARVKEFSTVKKYNHFLRFQRPHFPKKPFFMV